MGANEGFSEVSCTCGATFGTLGEYYYHVNSVHGVSTE
jgi:hypothetical protein